MNVFQPSNLKNPPLKEVIFEILWDLDFLAEQQVFVDTGFENAVINFHSSSRHELPYFERMMPDIIPSYLLSGRRVFKFSKNKIDNPSLYYLGPGMFSVNETNKNYSWPDFEKFALQGIGFLKGSYTKELIPSTVSLKYTDAIGCHILGDKDKFQFLKERLQVHAEKWAFAEGDLADIQFTKRFTINDELYLTLTFATARDRNTDEDLVVWHTTVSNRTRLTWENLPVWLDKAHTICSETFKKTIDPQLHEYFNN